MEKETLNFALRRRYLVGIVPKNHIKRERKLCHKSRSGWRTVFVLLFNYGHAVDSFSSLAAASRASRNSRGRKIDGAKQYEVSMAAREMILIKLECSRA